MHSRGMVQRNQSMFKYILHKRFNEPCNVFIFITWNLLVYVLNIFNLNHRHILPSGPLTHQLSPIDASIPNPLYFVEEVFFKKFILVIYTEVQTVMQNHWVHLNNPFSAIYEVFDFFVGLAYNSFFLSCHFKAIWPFKAISYLMQEINVFFEGKSISYFFLPMESWFLLLDVLAIGDEATVELSVSWYCIVVIQLLDWVGGKLLVCSALSSVNWLVNLNAAPVVWALLDSRCTVDHRLLIVVQSRLELFQLLRLIRWDFRDHFWL